MTTDDLTHDEFLAERRRIWDGEWDAVDAEVIVAEVERLEALAKARERRGAMLGRAAFALRVAALSACFANIAWIQYGAGATWVRAATYCAVFGLWWWHWPLAKRIDERRYDAERAARGDSTLARLLQRVLDTRNRPPPVRLVRMAPEQSAAVDDGSADGFVVEAPRAKREGPA